MFGIGMGPSSQEKQQYGSLTNASNFATGLGQQDLTQSSNFMTSILSGDATKTAQVLAPQISSAKTSLQQDQKSAAQNGTRSGGTVAANNAAGDKVHANITDLIGSLTGSSASGLASTGGNLLSTGISGTQAAFGEANTLQKQREAQINDIFSSVGQVAGAAAGMPGVGKGAAQGLNAFAGAF